jgi:hypothetical protein
MVLQDSRHCVAAKRSETQGYAPREDDSHDNFKMENNLKLAC